MLIYFTLHSKNEIGPVFVTVKDNKRNQLSVFAGAIQQDSDSTPIALEEMGSDVGSAEIKVGDGAPYQEQFIKNGDSVDFF